MCLKGVLNLSPPLPTWKGFKPVMPESPEDTVAPGQEQQGGCSPSPHEAELPCRKQCKIYEAVGRKSEGLFMYFSWAELHK